MEIKLIKKDSIKMRATPLEIIKELQNNDLDVIRDYYPELYTLIMSITKENDTPHQTHFPDFVGINGFIECFDISSSKETSKGSKIHKLEGNAQEEIIDFLENSPNSSYSVDICRDNTNNDVDYFHKSILKNVEHHLASLNNYSGKKHLACFLMCSDDYLKYAIWTALDNDAHIPDNLSEKGNYDPHYDKQLLEYLYTLRNDLDCIIYYNYNFKTFAIIKLSNIPAILKAYHSFSDIEYGIHSSCTVNDAHIIVKETFLIPKNLNENKNES